MLEAKPWKSDAVLRLVVSVFVCICLGSILASLVLHGQVDVKANSPLVLSVGTVALVSLLGTLRLLASPWPADKLLWWASAMLATFYLGVALGAWLFKLVGPPTSGVWQMVFAACSFQGAALLLVGGFLREHGMGYAEALGLRKFAGAAIALGAVAALVFLPVGWGLQQLSSFILTHLPVLGIKPVEQQAVQTLRTAALPLDRFALAGVTIFLAPLAEEILFRGVLYPWIKRIGFPQIALWGSSLLFALVHFNIVTFLPLLCLALVLVWLYEFTGNLLASITAHALFNALNFALLLLVSDN